MWSLNTQGQLNKILPFTKKSKVDNSVFYTLNFKKSDVSSNILNNDIERNYFTVGLTKRFNLFN